jgi:hypothetical protein
MSYIKNRFFEEINKKDERFEDSEFFHQQTQKLNLKPINGNGKEKQSNQSNKAR